MAETTATNKKTNRYTGNYQQPSWQPNANAPIISQQNGAVQPGNSNMWFGGTGQRWGQSNSNVAITSDLMAQAELYYKAAYEAQRLAAQQTHDESQLLLDQQLSGLQATYDQQREQSRENYAQAYSQADRQALSRGMQRSSYNNATLGNISIAGNEAQQAINDTQAAQTSNLQEQKTLYGRQLQQTLESLTKQQQADVQAKADELKKRQEELRLQQQQLQLQQQQMGMEFYMWQQEFNEKYGDKGGGGGSSSKPKSSGGGSKTTTIPDHGIDASNTVTDVLDEYMKANKLGKYKDT